MDWLPAAGRLPSPSIEQVTFVKEVALFVKLVLVRVGRRATPERKPLLLLRFGLGEAR